MLKCALPSRKPKDYADTETPQQPGGLNRALSQIQRKYTDILGPPEIYTRLPKTCLRPDRILLLLQTLELSHNTSNLTTIVAGLPKPLARSQSSNWPRELCTLHSWFNASYLNHFAQLIAKELHYRSEYLYKASKDALHRETRHILYFNLAPYKDVFVPKYYDDSDVELVKTPMDAFATKTTYMGEKCVACQLNDFLRDVDAVASLALLCKSRKRHGYEWPELLAFLEPVPIGSDDHWRRRWLSESHTLRKDRNKIRLARKCGGESEQAIFRSEVGEEVPIVYSPDREDFAQAGVPWSAETVGAFKQPAGPWGEGNSAQPRSIFEDDYDDEGALDGMEAQDYPILRSSEEYASRGPTMSEIQEAREVAFKMLTGTHRQY